MLAVCALLTVAQAPVEAAVERPPAAEPAAGEAARILVVPARDADAARVEDIYAGLRAAGLLVVDSDERAGVDLPGGAPPRLGARDEVRALLNDARARFRELDLGAARAAVDAAIDELLRLDRPDEALDLFADALLLRANLSSAAGADPRDDLMLLSRLDPSREVLHPGLYPPSLVDAYAAARQRALEAERGTLEVRPRVAGFAPALISIDGVAQHNGTSMGLPRGPHLLVIRARGALPFARVVDVGEDPLIFEPFLEAGDAAAHRATLVETARTAKDDATRTAALAGLSALCAARSVVLLEGAPQLFHDGKLRPLNVEPRATGNAIGVAVLAALQAPARRTLEPPVDDELPLAAIAGVGAAAVLLSGAIAIGVWALWPASQKDDPPRPVTVEGLTR